MIFPKTTLPHKPVVCLYDLADFALIIKSPDGIYYHNQVGGHACMQEVVSGHLIPIRDHWGMLSHLGSFFAEEANYAGIAGGLRSSDDLKLNKIFQERHDPNDSYVLSPLGFLRIAPELMAESVEAWLHVIISDCPADYPHPLSINGEAIQIERKNEKSGIIAEKNWNFSGLAGAKAILTWCNSD